MPFTTDTAWPAGLLKIFETCRHGSQTSENRYYGPYNSLLTYCFGTDSTFEFFVAPQSAPDELDAPLQSFDFIVFLIVFDNQHRPVLMAEIKNDGWVNTAHLRFTAEEQMRQRYELMLGSCALPRLWGLSLLGTSLRVYCGDVATSDVQPAFADRPHPTRLLPPNFLEGASSPGFLA